MLCFKWNNTSSKQKVSDKSSMLVPYSSNPNSIRSEHQIAVPPMFWIPNQLEAAYVGKDVNLECHSEAFPKSINYWVNKDGAMLVSSMNLPHKSDYKSIFKYALQIFFIKGAQFGRELFVIFLATQGQRLPGGAHQGLNAEPSDSQTDAMTHLPWNPGPKVYIYSAGLKIRGYKYLKDVKLESKINGIIRILEYFKK